MVAFGPKRALESHSFLFSQIAFAARGNINYFNEPIAQNAKHNSK
jgi:hypothetical protein